MALFNDAASLLFTVKANTDEARNDFKKFRSEVKETADAAGAGASPLEKLAHAAGISGSEFSAMSGPIGIATAAITAAAAAAVSGTVALFHLAQTAGEYGDQIFDTAQKTNVSTDAIQAFNFAAEQSGSSTEQVNKSLAKFSALLGQAADGNEKAQAILEQYNITATDTDKALQQAVESIMAMTDANQQNSAAAALFKDRGGDVINMIREMDGDLPGAIQKLTDMGLLMSRDNVKAAAAFTDELDLLKKQLTAVGRTIGTEVIPPFMQMATEISDWLKANPGQVKAWATSFADALRFVAKELKATRIIAEDVIDAIESAFAAGSFGGSSTLNAYADRHAERNRQLEALTLAAKNRIQGGGLQQDAETVMPGGVLLGDQPKPVFKPVDKDAEEEAKKAEEKRAKERLDLARRDADARVEILRGQLSQSEEAYQDYYERLAERAAAGEDTALLTKEGEQRERQMGTERLEILNKLDAAEKNLAVQLKRTNTEIVALDQKQIERRERTGKLSQDALDKYAKAADDAEKKAGKTAEENRKKALAGWEKARDIQRQTYDIQAQGDKDRDEERAKDKKHWNEKIEALQRQMDIEAEADADKREQYRKQTEQGSILNTSIGGGIAGSLGVDLVSIFDKNDQVKSQADYMKDIFADMSSSIGESLGQIVDAMGQMLIAWIVTGEFSAKAALQMAAGVALGIAQQALVKGIFEYAEGVAALANPFLAWTAPYHFAAAKLYFTTAAVAGSIGVGLAVGARAVSGENSGGYGSAGGSRNSAQSDRERDTSPISRVSDDAYDSGRRPGNGPLVRMARAAVAARDREAQMANLTDAVNNLHNKISSMRPEDVMTVAAERRPQVIGRAVKSELHRDPSLGTTIQRKSGSR